jgi:hypothetical protein
MHVAALVRVSVRLGPLWTKRRPSFATHSLPHLPTTPTIPPTTLSFSVSSANARVMTTSPRSTNTKCSPTRQTCQTFRSYSWKGQGWTGYWRRGTTRCLVILGLCASLFGIRYALIYASLQVKETIPSLAELGGHQLYPTDPGVGECTLSDIFHNIEILSDRRPALLTILKSTLVTYSHLLNALLAPPPTSSSNGPPEWQRHVEWITVMSQNLMAAANDLRPVQVCLIFHIGLSCGVKYYDR